MNKKEFETLHKKYVYDQIKNEFCEIDMKKMTLIKKSEGYDSNCTSFENVFKENHQIVDILPDMLESCLSHFVIQTTQECNLKCSYCNYAQTGSNQRKHSNKKLTKEKADEIVNFILRHSAQRQKIKIGFYGGEPFLNFEIIKYIIEKLESYSQDKDFMYFTTTNGTLLSNSILKFIEAKNFKLTISLDGCKETHDKNRKFPNGEGTFLKIMNNIKNIRDNYQSLFENTMINMVIDQREDFDKYNQILDEIEGLNVLKINADLIDDSLSSIKINASDNFVERWKEESFKNILSILINQPRNSIILGSVIRSLSQTFNTLSKINMQGFRLPPSGPCIAGYFKTFINADGKIYPCEKVNENSEALCFGTIENELDYNKASEISKVNLISLVECNDCFAVRLCRLCGTFCDNGKKICKKKKLSFCRNVRSGAYESIMEYLTINEFVNEFNNCESK